MRTPSWTGIDWIDECPVCGEEVEVYTDCKEFNTAYDGDLARCKECHHKGWVSVYDDDAACIMWEDE